MHGPSHESTHEYTTQQTTPPELHRCFPSSLSSGRHERIDRELGLGPAGAPLVGREASHRPTPGRSPSIARLLGSALDALPQAARSRTSPGCPVSRSPPQPRPRGGGARDATRSRARCPTPGRAAFPSPDLSAARRELQVLLCDSVFLGVHHLRVQVVINYGLLLVREVLHLLRCSLQCLELGTSKSSLALYQSCTSM